MKTFLRVGVALWAAAVGATDYTFTPTATDADWSNPANYSPAITTLPGAADTVATANATYEVAVPSASFSAIAGMKRLIPNGCASSGRACASC